MYDKPQDIAALISSRICHDMASPLGAISNGLELLELSGVSPSPELALIKAQFTNRMRSWHVLFQIRGIGRLWITSSFRIGYLG